MSEKHRAPFVGNKLIMWIAMMFVAVFAVAVYFTTSFVSVSIHNARQQKIVIKKIKISPGILVGAPDVLGNKQTEFFSALILGQTASISFSLRTGDSLENHQCSIKKTGSDYCEINVAENGIGCVCFQ
jgi:flagellar basal body-associated protein FliL